MTTTIMEKISKARGIVLSAAPYFARGLFRMRFVEDASVPTMGISPAFQVRFNPAFVEGGLTMEELGGVILHELLHPIGGHFARQGERRAQFTNGLTVWNAATDVLVNDTVRAMGLRIPDGAVTRESWGVPEDLLTAEDVYDWMIANVPPEGGGGSWQDGDGGDVRELGEGEELEGDESVLAKQVAADVKDHANRHPSKVPSSVEMWADSVLAKPRVRWQDVLRSRRARAVSSWVKGNEHPTFGRRSRRQDGVGDPGGYVLPGRVSPRPLTTVIVDMSGSMSDKGTGSAVLGSVAGILDASGGEVIAITCDTAAVVLGPVRDAYAIARAGRHGGGTDMGPAFEEARRMRAACIVCITDGYLPQVADSAIWLITPGGEPQPWMRGLILRYE
ncbi:MAG: VWA-like domain-containing protein [Rhodospirillaceae bacterium]